MEPDTPFVPTICELLDFGKRFNAVVFGNLTISGGDSEGNLLVWGNATLPFGYSIGIPVIGDPIPAACHCDDALIVGGDLLIGNQDVNGNIVYGGAYLGDARTWNSYLVRHVASVTLDRYGNVPEDGSGRTAADLLAAVTEVSSRVAEMEPTGTVSTNSNSMTLTGTNDTRNVFPVSAEQWSGSQRDWIFDVPAGSKVIVNVTGPSVDITNGRMALPKGVTQKDVLVNYIDATLLTFSGFDHAGSVLAPFASGSFSGGAIEGIAIFGGDVVTNVQTITSAAEALVTYTATVTAKAYESATATAAFASRTSVTATDVAVVNFAAGASGTGTSGNPAACNPTERVDYEVEEMWFSCILTFAGETFTVNVRVKNNGEIDGNGAFLELYLVDVDHGATIDADEVDTAHGGGCGIQESAPSIRRTIAFSGQVKGLTCFVQLMQPA